MQVKFHTYEPVGISLDVRHSKFRTNPLKQKIDVKNLLVIQYINVHFKIIIQ